MVPPVPRSRPAPGHAAAAARLARALGEQPLAEAVAAVQALSGALEEAFPRA